jgi:arylsulfatase A-like enzyme
LPSIGSNDFAVSKGSNFCCKFRDSALPLLLQPALIGAILFVSLSSWALAIALRTDTYEGADAAGVRQFLSGEYRGEVLRVVGLVLALSALLGMMLGLAVGGAIRLRQAWLKRAPLERGSLAWQSCLGIVVLCGFAFLDDVVARPALYQDLLYGRGGACAAFQVWTTDHCGRLTISIVVGLLGAAWLLVPLVGMPGAKAQLRKFGVLVLAATGCLALASIPWRRVVSFRRQAASSDRVNILIVAADSLRPDRITPAIAPRMYSLAQTGTVFDHAYTPLARTFPAWVSMLTGNYPHHHGIRNMFPRWETRMRDFHAIPAAFAKAGYLTCAVSDFAGDIFRRVDLGFQKLRTPTFTMRELLRERILQQDFALLPWLRGPLARWAVPVLREMHVASDAQALTNDALDAIDGVGQQPFFMTIFYSTTHFPYAAPFPFYKRFVSSGYRGKYRYAKADTLTAENSLTPSDVEHVRGLFDGAVSSVDAAVGELLDGLTARGLTDHTIVVLTADHGESLYENGRGQGHGDHLYGDESLRVPLVFVRPGGIHTVVATPVSSIDLAPTLCKLSRVDCHKNIDGQSLAEALNGQPIQRGPIFSETGLWFTETLPEVPFEKRLPYPDLIHLTEVDRIHSDEIVVRREWVPLSIAAKYRMIRDNRFKLVYIPTRLGPRYELFDTVQDPGETHDVSAPNLEVVLRLKPMLMDWILEDVELERQKELIVPRAQNNSSGATR